MFETSKFVVLFFILYTLFIHKSVEIKMNLEMNLERSGYRPKEHTLAKYIVSLKGGRQTKLFGDNHYCTGSIVSPKVILTAAHCIINPKGIKRFEDIYLVAGTPFLFTLTSSTRLYRVQSTVIHPEYRYDTMETDLALLILEEKIKEGNAAAEFTLDNELPRHDTTCIILGWGALYKDGPRPNEILYANLIILRRSFCNLNQPLYTSIFCLDGVDSLGESVWRGDSASPVVCNGKLTGVISLDNATKNGPIPFSSVYENLNWINTIISDKSTPKHNFGIIYYILYIGEVLIIISISL